MRIDLHVHTSPRSPCSIMAPMEAACEAARLGLDGICLTEHHRLWPRQELDRLAGAAGIRVFGGTEITSDQGDILVFGLSSEVEQVTPIAELRRMVEDEGGFMIAAHPFRGFLLFGPGQLGLAAEHACEYVVFKHVDAVEVCNGRLSGAENETARRVAGQLGLPGVAGSDAHALDELGRCVTVFETPVADERQLCEHLRNGAFTIEVA